MKRGRENTNVAPVGPSLVMELTCSNRPTRREKYRAAPSHHVQGGR
jgi:hypothetical protein